MSAGTESLWPRLKKLGFPNYASYLSSGHWRSVRQRFFASKIYKGCCNGCGCTDKPLEIHHRTYKRFGREHLGDLMALCRFCHQSSHDIENRGIQLWKATGKALNKARNKRSP